MSSSSDSNCGGNVACSGGGVRGGGGVAGLVITAIVKLASPTRACGGSNGAPAAESAMTGWTPAMKNTFLVKRGSGPGAGGGGGN